MKVLYYEIHITIEPQDETNIIQGLCIVHNFKLAKLLMQKRDSDTPERSMYDTFVTGHRTDKAQAIQDTIGFVKAIQKAGIKVWRYKIEDVTLDSRNNDTLELLI